MFKSQKRLTGTYRLLQSRVNIKDGLIQQYCNDLKMRTISPLGSVCLTCLDCNHAAAIETLNWLSVVMISCVFLFVFLFMTHCCCLPAQAILSLLVYKRVNAQTGTTLKIVIIHDPT